MVAANEDVAIVGERTEGEPAAPLPLPLIDEPALANEVGRLGVSMSTSKPAEEERLVLRLLVEAVEVALDLPRREVVEGDA